MAENINVAVYRKAKKKKMYNLPATTECSSLQTNTFAGKLFFYAGILTGTIHKLAQFHSNVKTSRFGGGDTSLERVCSTCNILYVSWEEVLLLENGPYEEESKYGNFAFML